MANRYFVDGGVDLNWSTSGNWSAETGGEGGETVPTSSDDVFLDGSSPNCTVDAAASFKSLTCTGYTGTLTQSADMNAYGNITFVAGMTFTWTAGYLYFKTSATTHNFAGKHLGNVGNDATGAAQYDYVLSAGDVYIDGDFDQFVSANPGKYRYFAPTASANLYLGGDLLNTAGYGSFSWNYKYFTLQMVGAIDQTINYSGNTPIVINKPAGTLYFTDLYIAGYYAYEARITHTAGTVSPSGTIHVRGSSSVYLNISFTVAKIIGDWLVVPYMVVENNFECGEITTGEIARIAGEGFTLEITGSALGGTSFATNPIPANIKMVGTGNLAWQDIYNPIEIDTAGKITVTATTLAMRKALTITAGELDLNGKTMTLYDNFTNGGTFTHSNGPVVLAGTSTLAGHTHFKNVTQNAGAVTHLTAGDEFIVEGTYAASGTTASPVVLDTTTPDTQAKWTVTTLGVVAHVMATDIDSSDGVEISDRNGTLDNATNWVVRPIQSPGIHLIPGI